MATLMFIKFENPTIEGSSNVPGHQKEIEILSWSHGFVQPTSPMRSSAGAGTEEMATHQNFTFTKYMDAATNELLKICWNGKQIAKVILTCYRSGSSTDKPVSYLIVTMEHVIVSNYSLSGGPGDIPVENISLDYGIISYSYFEKHDPESAEGRKAKHNLQTRTVE